MIMSPSRLCLEYENVSDICNIFPTFPRKLIGDTCLASIKFIKTLPGTS